jgi:AcrR family transcriptional regulator
MSKKKDTKEKILAAAVAEFSELGFAGARMERIAQRADINKAMLHYYFSSKEKLYQEAIKQGIKRIFPKIRNLLLTENDPEKFLEKLPRLYISFFWENQTFVRMISFNFLQYQSLIREVFSDFFTNRFSQGPRFFRRKIIKWHEAGKISEPDPAQFILNVVSLCLFFVIAKPIMEAILDIKVDETFFETRITSVINILKRGMLT